MHEITPEAQRQALAQQHRQSLANAPQRSRRQAARLHLLQLWGQRYPKAAPAAPQRILVIRPDHLGDLLFATPALHLLRASFPDAHIAALVGPWGEAVLTGNPDLDETIPCPFPGFTRQPKGSPLEPYRLLRREAHRLAAMQFDLALVLRFDHWWGGYAIAEVQPFLTQATPYVPGRHEVVQNLALALAAGDGERLTVTSKRLSVNGERSAISGGDGFDSDWRLRFAVGAGDEAAAAALLPAADRPVVALHPGSGAAVKRWRSAAWAELAGRLAVEHGAQVISALRAGDWPGQRPAAPGRGRGNAHRASLRPGGPAHLRPVGRPATACGGHVGLGLHPLQPAGLAHGCVRDIAVETVWAAARQRLLATLP